MGTLKFPDDRQKYSIQDIIKHRLSIDYALSTNPPTTLCDAVLLYEYAWIECIKAGDEHSLPQMSGWWWGAKSARENRQKVARIMFDLTHNENK